MSREILQIIVLVDEIMYNLLGLKRLFIKYLFSRISLRFA